MAKETYRQCHLQRKSGETHVAWIPKQFARKGAVVAIQFDGIWHDGFEVKEVFPGAWTDKEADGARKDHKRFQHVLGD